MTANKISAISLMRDIREKDKPIDTPEGLGRTQNEIDLHTFMNKSHQTGTVTDLEAINMILAIFDDVAPYSENPWDTGEHLESLLNAVVDLSYDKVTLDTLLENGCDDTTKIKTIFNAPFTDNKEEFLKAYERLETAKKHYIERIKIREEFYKAISISWKQPTRTNNILTVLRMNHSGPVEKAILTTESVAIWAKREFNIDIPEWTTRQLDTPTHLNGPAYSILTQVYKEHYLVPGCIPKSVAVNAALKEKGKQHSEELGDFFSGTTCSALTKLLNHCAEAEGLQK